jgi:hypothetical protein
MTIARPTSLICAAISIFSLTFGLAAPALADDSICEAEMTRAAEAHDVPLGVLYAVGMTETGRRGKLHPYALNIAGRSYFGTGVRDAVETFHEERRRGVRLIDLGCMQINHHYHGREFDTVEDMLDPVQNVEYAARFLKQLRAREGSWTLAVARYHAGSNNLVAQKRYVCAVIRNMVASGFGEWTANARTFCA